MKRLLAGLMLICSAVATQAFAVPQTAKDVEHVCTDEDLIGHTWKMMSITEMPHRKELNWFETAPYQYLTFYQKKQYGYLASNTELKAEWLRQEMLNWPRRGKHTLQYTLTEDGVLDLYLDSQVKYRYRCVYVSKSHNGFVKGDLKLNGYSTQYKKGKVYKLYRLWY